MKARKLRALLNNTGYTICNDTKYISVDSAMCHGLIKVYKDTLNIVYCLDTFREGRDCLVKKTNSKNENELLFIWDKLQELIDSGEIHDIINGKDEIENPLPVFTVKNGILIESVTDAYGYPNIDDNGFVMYENTHYPTREQAIKYGISDCEAGVKLISRKIEELKNDLSKWEDELKLEKERLQNLNNQL